MQVIVKLFGEFREVVKAERVEVDLPPGATCLEALRALAAQHPQLQPLLFRGDFLHDHLGVFLNGRNVAHLQGLATPLQDGDTLTFFSPISGG